MGCLHLVLPFLWLAELPVRWDKAIVKDVCVQRYVNFSYMSAR